MITRDTPWPAGTPCWIDLSVPDLAKARKFYGDLFGWTTEVGPEEFANYTNASLGGRLVAGLVPQQSPDQPVAWTTYLASEDAAATEAKVQAAGGTVLMPVMDVSGIGRMGMFADPAGAVFGVWEAGTHTGAQLANAPGALAWNENMSLGFEDNQKFYADVFGYSYGDLSSEGFQYATFATSGDPAGGIGAWPPGTPAGTPAAWGVYFGVADTDATVAKAQELGGSLVDGPRDSPYGRMARLADDQGALFSVMSVPTD
jgi:predicted enzyme related to lactoylglutathione lyase